MKKEVVGNLSILVLQEDYREKLEISWLAEILEKGKEKEAQAHTLLQAAISETQLDLDSSLVASFQKPGNLFVQKDLRYW
jgi:hypothetical protein